MDKVQPGDVLVTDMTDPNWEPVMKRASAIVTNRGGRTCHAAIIARELGIPAVVGCGDATDAPADGALVTVACSEGDTGFIYDGLLETEVTEVAARRDAVLPGEDHDERRQPDSWPSTSRRSRTPGSAWRGWNSSSTTTSACTRRRSSTTRTSTPT
jgi:phosphohistidine swiveling domain-containing protein